MSVSGVGMLPCSTHCSIGVPPSSVRQYMDMCGGVISSVLGECALPLLNALVGQAVHQVYADIVKAGVGCLTVGMRGIGGGVCRRPSVFSRLSSKLCTPMLKRLTPQSRYAASLGALKSPGVGFERYLRVGRKGECVADSLHDAADVVGGQV